MGERKVEITRFGSGPQGPFAVIRHIGSNAPFGRVTWSVVGNLVTTRSGFRSLASAERYAAGLEAAQ
jgi:hypothetical protein